MFHQSHTWSWMKPIVCWIWDLSLKFGKSCWTFVQTGRLLWRGMEMAVWQLLAVVLIYCIFNIWHGLIVVAALWSYCILKMAQFDTGSTFYFCWLFIKWLSSLLHSSWWCHVLCGSQCSSKQDRQFMYNIRLRHICISIIAVEKAMQ